MPKRLQVILKDPEYRDVQRAARSRHMSIAEWVRQALQLAQRAQPEGSSHKKLEVVQAATKHVFPTGEIGKMLSEIESGYLADRSGDQ